jgi:hypothetical protein
MNHHPPSTIENLSSSVKHRLSSDSKYPSFSTEEQLCLDRVRFAQLDDEIHPLSDTKRRSSSLTSGHQPAFDARDDNKSSKKTSNLFSVPFDVFEIEELQNDHR